MDDEDRNLIANLVAMHGTREAEMIVRGWTANMALPAFDSEQDRARPANGA